MFPDVLIITLANRRERCEVLRESLSRAGFSSISFVDAVDWRELSGSPPWSVRDLPETYPYKGWCDPYARRALTLGEVGCTLSHALIWRQVIESGRPALVLEDDAVLIEDLVDQIPHVLYDLSCLDFSLCYFSHRNDEGVRPLAGRLIHTVTYHPVWTLAYMVTPLGAKTLFESAWNRHLVPADDLMPAVFVLHRDPYMNGFFAGQDAAMGSRGIVVSTSQRFFTIMSGNFSDSETEKSPPIIERNESFLALTVATEENDGLRRLCRSSERYGFSIEVLGLGESWRGGDMSAGIGGGQKVNLLRSRLADVPAGTVVLFCDGYDVIVSGYINDMLSKWRSMGSKVVFAAERFCWPDEAYRDLYPSCDTPYCFLNSGIFMGTAGDLRLLLHDEISDDADDQRYYTELFLGVSEGDRGGPRGADDSNGISDKIILDSGCRIFQCLHGSLDDVSVDEGRGMLYNKETDSWPFVIHANGPVKDWLESGGRSVGGRYRHNYGSME